MKEKPFESLVGVFIVAAGIPIYFVWQSLRHANSEFGLQIVEREYSPMVIRITRVYTRTGDKGETSLVGGKRVPKDSPRIDAYGTIDELNSIVGLARVFNEENLDAGEAHQFLDEVLCKIQDELFDLGSELATPPEFFRTACFAFRKLR